MELVDLTVDLEYLYAALELVANSVTEPVMVDLKLKEYPLERLLFLSTATFKPFKLLSNEKSLNETINQLLNKYGIYEREQSQSEDVLDFSHLEKYTELERIFSPEREYGNLAHLQQELIDCDLGGIGSNLFVKHPSEEDGTYFGVISTEPNYKSMLAESDIQITICKYELLI